MLQPVEIGFHKVPTVFVQIFAWALEIGASTDPPKTWWIVCVIGRVDASTRHGDFDAIPGIS
jgi:hypothetical protein